MVVHRPRLHMRIGVHYGDVVIGLIRAKSRRDDTAIGDVFNRERRQESNEQMGGVCIAENAY